MEKCKLSEKANRLPLLPGVYIMRDFSGNVIYVGKAKRLKNRVTSYFHGEHTAKVSAMIEKISDFEVIIVSSELEALVLENSLIKKYKPHYNILLKDDKGYPFIRLNYKTDYPRPELCREPAQDGAMYFGPFGARRTTHEIINELINIFALPDCSRKFPRDIGKERPCLNYHIGKCSGWCLAENTKEQYRNVIDQMVLLLKGSSASVVNSLKDKMLSASEELDFEKAADYRDKIQLIEALTSKQRVLSNSIDNTDIIGFSTGAKCCLTVMSYIDGNLSDKKVIIFDSPVEDDDEALMSVMGQYYLQDDAFIPHNILLGKNIEFISELESILALRAEHSVKIEIPKKGRKAELLRCAQLNAEEELKRVTSDIEKNISILKRMQKLLSLHNFPSRIEAYDISNLGNSGIVAAMTVFIDGKKTPKEYRKFRLSELNSQDDYLAMYICLSRRIARYVDGDAAFADRPDLILVDGGHGQVKVAVDAVQQFELDIPIFGMVKDNRHRTRALVDCLGNEIEISDNYEIFPLIGRIQEETHRFAIEYQRKLRNENFSSKLENIPGIGEKRKNILLNHFKSLNAVKNADLEELRKVLPDNAALSVFQFYHDAK